jgi:hypothetical protein
MSGNEWRHRDDLRCIGRTHEFTELPIGRNAQKVIASLIYECFQCPAIVECLADAKKRPPKGGIIQGGELWK